MVNYGDDPLDRVFAALSDPTRRRLVARLGDNESLTVSELAEPFAMSLPAVMKHLDVLSDAGLITRRKSGRSVNCRLTAATMKSAMDWLHRYERFWSDRLSRLGAFLEEDESCPPKPPSNQATPSSATSRRRPPRSSPPGPTRKK
jgi:DNA-binding transcriptional ArsR family regulator